MLSTKFVCHIDECGRIIFPIANLNSINLRRGDPVEITLQKDGTITIRKYKKTWEDTVLDWWKKYYRRPAMKRAEFYRMGDYTFCVITNVDCSTTVGVAKRFCKDTDNEIIGKVAAFARALGTPINELIGWKG